MKRAIGMFGLLAVLFATLSLATIADSKTMTWTGWISDDHCGEVGTTFQFDCAGCGLHLGEESG